MDFTQPTGIPTPKEFDTQITALRVQIADKEAEIVRLESVVKSNKYAIQQTSNEKAELESVIIALKEAKQGLEITIEDLNKQIVQAQETLTSVKSEASKIQIDAEFKLSQAKAKEVEIENAQADIKLNQDFLKVRLDEVGKQKEELSKKFAQLKEIIN